MHWRKEVKIETANGDEEKDGTRTAEAKKKAKDRRTAALLKQRLATS